MAKSLWTIPFGKYVGKDIEDVPEDYLEWLIMQDWFCTKFPDGLKAITIELEYRERWSDE